MLYSLFSKIWEKEEVPAQWKEGIIKPPPPPPKKKKPTKNKKGDLWDCSHYRGIMVLSTPCKALKRVLLERMKEAVDPNLRDQQAGFRRNRSCADQIASLRIIVEQSPELNSPLYINFIDYRTNWSGMTRAAQNRWVVGDLYSTGSELLFDPTLKFQDFVNEALDFISPVNCTSLLVNHGVNKHYRAIRDEARLLQLCDWRRDRKARALYTVHNKKRIFLCL